MSDRLIHKTLTELKAMYRAGEFAIRHGLVYLEPRHVVEHVLEQDELKLAKQRIADLERRNGLLRAVVNNHRDLLLEIMGARVGHMGDFGTVYSGKNFSTERIKLLYQQVQSAIDGGALEGE